MSCCEELKAELGAIRFELEGLKNNSGRYALKEELPPIIQIGRKAQASADFAIGRFDGLNSELIALGIIVAGLKLGLAKLGVLIAPLLKILPALLVLAASVGALIGLSAKVSQLEGRVDTHDSLIDSATDTANNALIKGSTALGQINRLKIELEIAKADAKIAKQQAESAIKKAEEAIQKSNLAISRANTAIEKADKAINQAQLAINAANTANSIATNANQTANQAKEESNRAYALANESFVLTNQVKSELPGIRNIANDANKKADESLGIGKGNKTEIAKINSKLPSIESAANEAKSTANTALNEIKATNGKLEGIRNDIAQIKGDINQVKPIATDAKTKAITADGKATTAQQGVVRVEVIATESLNTANAATNIANNALNKTQSIDQIRTSINSKFFDISSSINNQIGINSEINNTKIDKVTAEINQKIINTRTDINNTIIQSNNQTKQELKREVIAEIQPTIRSDAGIKIAEVQKTQQKQQTEINNLQGTQQQTTTLNNEITQIKQEQKSIRAEVTQVKTEQIEVQKVNKEANQKLDNFLVQLNAIITMIRQLFETVNKILLAVLALGTVAKAIQIAVAGNGAAIGNMANGMKQNFTKLGSFLQLGRIMDVLTFAATVHNGAMLSRNLGQTLLMTVSNVLAAVGIKDMEGNVIDLNKVVGQSIEQMLKTAIGAENYENASAQWKLYSTILNSAANVWWTVTSLQHSILSAIEMVGGQTALIGNALKKYRQVAQNAFGWMNPTPNFNNRFFTALEVTSNGVSAIDSVASEVINAQETITRFGQVKDDLDKSMKQEVGSKQGSGVPEAKAIKAAEDLAIAASKSPNIPKESLVKPEV